MLGDDALMELPAVAKMCEVANEVLGYDLRDVCVNGPKEKLDDTVREPRPLARQSRRVGKTQRSRSRRGVRMRRVRWIVSGRIRRLGLRRGVVVRGRVHRRQGAAESDERAASARARHALRRRSLRRRLARHRLRGSE